MTEIQDLPFRLSAALAIVTHVAHSHWRGGPPTRDLADMLEEGMTAFSTILEEYPTAPDELLWARLFQRLNRIYCPSATLLTQPAQEVSLAS